MLVLGSGTFSGTAPSVQFTTSCPAKSFKVEAAGGGTIGTQTSGVPFGIQITALDANNNVATGFNGTAQLTSSPAGLDGSPVAGHVRERRLEPEPQRLHHRRRFVHVDRDVDEPIDHGNEQHLLCGYPALRCRGGRRRSTIGPQVAGAPFDIQVRLLDASDQVVTGFTGDVQLTSSPDGLVG